MKNYLRFLSPVMLLIMAVMFGGGKIYAQNSETFNFTSFTQQDEYTFKGKDCTITFKKNDGQTAPQWSSNQARLYPKGSLVVSSTKKITSIVYHYVVNAKKGNYPTISNVTPDGFSESSKTWSSETGSNNVVMTLKGSAGNFGFTSLDITYEDDGKTQTTLSFPTSSYTYEVGQNDGAVTIEDNIAVLKDKDGKEISDATGKITYSVVPEDVAFCDNKNPSIIWVDTSKEGTATVTATFDAAGTDEKYSTSTATYTIKVTKRQTTLSFGEAYDGKTINVNLGDEFTAPIATLTPNIEGATIKYSSNKPAVATVDETKGAVTINDDGTKVITADFVGDDTYGASTASYTIKVVDPNALVFSDDDENNSFGKLPTDRYIKSAKDYNLLAGNGLEYTFNMNYCYKHSGGIQMKKDGDGVIISPKFGFTYGYTVTIEYTSGTGITLSAGDKTVTGTENSSISLTTTSDIPFTIKTGSQYAVVKTIRVAPNSAPKTETLTTSAKGYATYSADYAVNYSELGLTAYTITIDEGNTTVTAKEFTGVVPAGKAVLVKGSASTAYTLTPATTEGDATFATDLKTGATKADGTQYGFTTKFGTPAFAQVQPNQDIPAKKGYIVLNSSSAAKYAIDFDGEATGIHTIEAASAANAAMYNLAGQRVDKAYKGIVIVNGKKYLNK